MTSPLRMLGLAGIAVLGVTFTPIPNWLARAVEVQERVERADAIVVLGNGINSDGSLYENSLRGAIHGIELFGRGLAPLLVFSGNRAGRSHEAEVRARLARSLGVDPGSILIETSAATTQEEVVRIAAQLEPRGVKTILLVTTPFHLARAVPLFERAGFAVLPAPAHPLSTALVAPDERLRLLWAMLSEVAARAYYRISGYL